MSARTTRMHEKRGRKEIPFVVWLWAMGLGFLSYVVGRIALNYYPHPYHWASGGVGLVVGFLVGWLWYRWKGDIA